MTAPTFGRFRPSHLLGGQPAERICAGLPHQHRPSRAGRDALSHQGGRPSRAHRGAHLSSGHRAGPRSALLRERCPPREPVDRSSGRSTAQRRCATRRRAPHLVGQRGLRQDIAGGCAQRFHHGWSGRPCQAGRAVTGRHPCFRAGVTQALRECGGRGGGRDPTAPAGDHRHCAGLPPGGGALGFPGGDTHGRGATRGCGHSAGAGGLRRPGHGRSWGGGLEIRQGVAHPGVDGSWGSEAARRSQQVLPPHAGISGVG